MNTQPPRSLRAKIVFVIWKNIPRLVLLLLFILIFMLSGVIKNKSTAIKKAKFAEVSQEKPIVKVVTLSLAPAEICDRISFPGSLEPWTTLPLLAKIRGTVTEVLVREGQGVKEGDIIAKIENADYRIARDRAAAAHTLAMAEYGRSKKVYAKGTISEADLESKKAAMQTARADLENAELLLSRCTVTAPIEGVVRSLNAKVGLLLSVADPVAELLQINHLKAIIGIPESDVTAVSGLDTVELCVQALGNEKITARKYFLPASPEPTARVYNLELEVDNSERTMFPGMFVRADIVKKRVDNAVIVPFYSVISRNGEQFVFVEHNGVAEKRPVHLGIMEKWMVEVTDGLHSSDQLIVEGHRNVEDGRKVQVVRNITDPGNLPQ